MINSVLIANRGEIACRILRTCHRLGIRTYVVYSEADSSSLAVQMADEAFLIGPSPPSQSYLNSESILKAAKKANVEAIHPGYGFLSENVDFAQACTESGFIFIGPSLENLQQMGSKSKAKAIAKKGGIPVIPGYEDSQKNLSKEADLIGYPLMIKAVMGGGGKGMRRVESKGEFQLSLEACQREALSSFGNSDVLIEKYIPHPRHIEVQIFGDTHGNLIHLFERDCSLQRRHQKVIEEAPSSLSPELKERIFEAALHLGHLIDYIGAGTVEFLVDQDGNFYFMEMNARLQVEHPVTESITGIDLVEWQFRIASHEKLPLNQQEIRAEGHAFELRLYAEDPRLCFKPQVGELWIKDIPKDVRIDTGYHIRDTISPYYDPLLAKLIVQGNDRLDALHQAEKALEQWKILGLTTNIPLLKNLLKDKNIVENKFDIGYIDRNLPQLMPSQNVPEKVYVASSLIKALLLSEDHLSPWEEKRNWRLDGYVPLTFTWVCEEEIKIISLTYVSSVPKTIQGKMGSIQETWIYEPLGPIHATLSGNTLFCSTYEFPFWKRDDHISVIYEEETYNVSPHSPLFKHSSTRKSDSFLKAPMTGKVSVVLVTEGEDVKENQPLLILEAMKMEHLVTSPRKGKVKRIFYKAGDIIEEGVIAIDLEEEKDT